MKHESSKAHRIKANPRCIIKLCPTRLGLAWLGSAWLGSTRLDSGSTRLDSRLDSTRHDATLRSALQSPQVIDMTHSLDSAVFALITALHRAAHRRLYHSATLLNSTCVQLLRSSLNFTQLTDRHNTNLDPTDTVHCVITVQCSALQCSAALCCAVLCCWALRAINIRLDSTHSHLDSAFGCLDGGMSCPLSSLNPLDADLDLDFDLDPTSASRYSPLTILAPASRV